MTKEKRTPKLKLSNGVCLEQRLRAPKAPGGEARGQPKRTSCRPGAWKITPKGPQGLTKNLPNIQLSSDDAATNTRGNPKKRLTVAHKRGVAHTHPAPQSLLPRAAPRKRAERKHKHSTEATPRAGGHSKLKISAKNRQIFPHFF